MTLTSTRRLASNCAEATIEDRRGQERVFSFTLTVVNRIRVTEASEFAAFALTRAYLTAPIHAALFAFLGSYELGSE